jgi:hypothetical protein
MRIFIPIHQPGEKHWLLASIYYEHRRVVFVESWGPTQKLYQSSGSNALAKLPLHKEVYEVFAIAENRFASDISATELYSVSFYLAFHWRQQEERY